MICQNCGLTYHRTSPRQRYCKTCGRKNQIARRRENARLARFEKSNKIALSNEQRDQLRAIWRMVNAWVQISKLTDRGSRLAMRADGLHPVE
jgi:restriction endonuclease